MRRELGLCMARTENCRGRAVHLHHMKMRSQGGSDDAENLMEVCSPCHDYIHAHPEESYVVGHLIHSWDDGLHTTDSETEGQDQEV